MLDKASQVKVKADSKGFFVRWQGSRAEATLGKMANSLFRPFNDWEVDSVEQFLLCLHEKRVVRDEDDRMIGCFGQRQRVASSQLSPFTLP